MAFMAMGNPFGNAYVFDGQDDIINLPSTAHQLDDLSNSPFRAPAGDTNKLRMKQMAAAGLKQSNNLLLVEKNERIFKSVKSSSWAPVPTILSAVSKFKRKVREKQEEGEERSQLPRVPRGSRPSIPGAGHLGAGRAARSHSVQVEGESETRVPNVPQKRGRGWEKVKQTSAFMLQRSAGKQGGPNFAESVVKHMARARRKRLPEALRRRLNAQNTGGKGGGGPTKGGRRWSTMVVEEEAQAFIRWQNDGEAKEFFRRQARKISIILSWGQVLKGYNDRLENQLKSFMDIARDIKEASGSKQIQEKTGLVFDPNDFKASKDVNLSSECISILTLPTHARTQDMVNKVIANLQTLQAFKEYPIHMQERLARVAWFQELEPRRLILREGHYAENFYFILAGEAVVKKIIPNPSTGIMQMTVLAVLKKGKSFGELALLHHSRRTASIETATTMQMLVISREDFLSIFMNMKDGEEPDHVRFLRTCTFMKNFPVGRLMDFPGACMFHFFGRATTVVADSNKNDWLYIVKTGSCSVIKKLTSVEAQKKWGMRRSRDLNLPIVWSEEPVAKVDSWRRSREEEEESHTENQSDDTAARFFATEREDTDLSQAKIHRRSTKSSTDSGKGSPTRRQSSVSSRLPDIKQSGEERETEDEIQEDESLDEEDEEPGDIRMLASSHKPPPDGAPGRSKSRGASFLPQLAQPNLKEELRQKPRPHTVPNPRKTLFKPKPSKEPKQEPKPKGNCYVQLRILKVGDVFGLEDIDFEIEPIESERTSVTLVSNGAELIMFSKKLFIRLANEHVQRYVREHRRLFPAKENLQENLQTEMNWRLFRQMTSDDVLAVADDIHNRASFSDRPLSNKIPLDIYQCKM